MSETDNPQPKSKFKDSATWDVIKLVLAALAGVLFFPLRDKVPWAWVSYLVWCVVFGLGFYSCWRVWSAKKPKVIFPEPRYPRPVRIVAVILAVVSACGGLLFLAFFAWTALLGLGSAISSGWQAMFPPPPPPPQVALEADKPVVHLGEFTKLTAKVDGKDVPKNWKCKWTTKPDIKFYASGRSNQRFRPSARFVKEGDSRRITFQVEVSDDRRKSIGTASVEVKVLYAPIVSMQADDSRIYDGDTTRVRVFLNDRRPKDGLGYAWTIKSGEAIDKRTPSPELLFEPGSILKDDEQSRTIDISVTVLDRNKEELGTAATKVTIVRRNPIFYAFVVDASGRMNQKPKTNTTLFSAAQQQILNTLSTVNSGGGQASLEIFGETPPSSGGDACKTTRKLLKMGPIDLAKVRNELKAIKLGGKDAPLILAIEKGIRSLGLAPNRKRGRYCLIVLTGGPDTCQQRDLAAFLASVRQMFAKERLQDIWLEYQVLSLTIAIAINDEEAKAWNTITSSDEYLERPHLVYVARNGQMLRAILQAVAGLNASSGPTRTRACNELIRLFDRQRDKSARKKIEGFCRQLAP